MLFACCVQLQPPLLNITSMNPAQHSFIVWANSIASGFCRALLKSNWHFQNCHWTVIATFFKHQKLHWKEKEDITPFSIKQDVSAARGGKKMSSCFSKQHILTKTKITILTNSQLACYNRVCEINNAHFADRSSGCLVTELQL